MRVAANASRRESALFRAPKIAGRTDSRPVGTQITKESWRETPSMHTGARRICQRTESLLRYHRHK